MQAVPSDDGAKGEDNRLLRWQSRLDVRDDRDGHGEQDRKTPASQRAIAERGIRQDPVEELDDTRPFKRSDETAHDGAEDYASGNKPATCIDERWQVCPDENQDKTDDNDGKVNHDSTPRSLRIKPKAAAPSAAAPPNPATRPRQKVSSFRFCVDSRSASSMASRLRSICFSRHRNLFS